MKFRLLIQLTLVFCFVSETKAQDTFAPIGAKWTYRISSFDSNGFTEIESIKDTILEDYNDCKVLQTIIYSLASPSATNWDLDTLENRYLCERNDSIVFYANNEFYLLYDFNAQLEDLWEFDNPFSEVESCSKVSVFVDSIGLYEIGDSIYKTFFMVPTDSSTMGFNFDTFPGIILENIGSITSYFWLSHIWPNCMVTDVGFFGKMCSYEDRERSYRFGDSYCNEVDLYYTRFQQTEIPKPQFYPNPVSQFLNITNIRFGSKISVFDDKGEVFFTSILNSHKVDLNFLPSGVFFVIITEIDNSRFIKKMVKL